MIAPAATAAMYTDQEWCWIDFRQYGARVQGTTSAASPHHPPASRRRHARVQACHRRETAEDLPEKPGISCRNVQKMGFRIAYLRPQLALPDRFVVFGLETPGGAVDVNPFLWGPWWSTRGPSAWVQANILPSRLITLPTLGLDLLGIQAHCGSRRCNR